MELFIVPNDHNFKISYEVKKKKPNYFQNKFEWFFQSWNSVCMGHKVSSSSQYSRNMIWTSIDALGRRESLSGRCWNGFSEDVASNAEWFSTRSSRLYLGATKTKNSSLVAFCKRNFTNSISFLRPWNLFIFIVLRWSKMHSEGSSIGIVKWGPISQENVWSCIFVISFQI